MSEALARQGLAVVATNLYDKNRPPYPGLGSELLLKPWTIVGKSGTLQLEGNVVYYWDSPGRRDEHMLRGQLIAGYQLIGPLQITLSALGVIRNVRRAHRGLAVVGVEFGCIRHERSIRARRFIRTRLC